MKHNPYQQENTCMLYLIHIQYTQNKQYKGLSASCWLFTRKFILFLIHRGRLLFALHPTYRMGVYQRFRHSKELCSYDLILPTSVSPS